MDIFIYNTTVYQAFSTYLRNKNGKLQNYFHFRRAFTPHFPCFLKKVPNSNNCLHLISWVTRLLLSLRAAVEILKLHSTIHSTENAPYLYKEAAVSLRGQKWPLLPSTHALV